MPLQPVETRRLYRQIADQLQALIAAGEWPLGTRLPAERELAGRLGVSRPSVREALIALEVQGLVEVRMGSGVYVVATQPQDPRRAAEAVAVLETMPGPFEVIRARQLIEAELAAQAATERDPALLADLARALDDMAAAIGRGEAPVEGDRQFHLRIALAADNALLLRTVRELYDARHGLLYGQLGQHFESPSGWRAALAEHAAVVQAIRGGDADAARHLMRQHLQHSHDRLAGLRPPEALPEPSATPRPPLPGAAAAALSTPSKALP